MKILKVILILVVVQKLHLVHLTQTVQQPQPVLLEAAVPSVLETILVSTMNVVSMVSARKFAVPISNALLVPFVRTDFALQDVDEIPHVQPAHLVSTVIAKILVLLPVVSAPSVMSTITKPNAHVLLILLVTRTLLATNHQLRAHHQVIVQGVKNATADTVLNLATVIPTANVDSFATMANANPSAASRQNVRKGSSACRDYAPADVAQTMIAPANNLVSIQNAETLVT